MKTRKLLSAFAAICVLASCSSDKDTDPTPGPGPGNTVKTRATLTFTVDESGNPASRAVSFPDRTSLPTERRIYNAVAIAFDNRGLLEDVTTFDEFKTDGVEPGQLTLTFDEISTGVHEFYVLANAPKSLLARQNELFPQGMTLSTFKQQIAELTSVNDIIREKTTYTASDLDLNTRGFMMSSQEPAFKNLEVDAANNIEVVLVRVAAKVSVAFDPEEELFGNLSDVEYKVVNNPVQTYVLPTVDNGTVMTPLFNTPYSPNNYTGAAHDYKAAILPGTAPADMTYTYCVENNNMEALQGNSTMVYIRGVFTPEKVYDTDQVEMTPTGATFWRIYKSYNDVWDEFYYGEEPQNLDPGDEVVEYKNGVCYYHTWLKNAAADRYFVKRNTYVKLTITSVSGAGWPDEGDGVDPEKPIDESTDANITVRVVDWEDDIQEGGI